jgi:hypothetical protein
MFSLSQTHAKWIKNNQFFKTFNGSNSNLPFGGTIARAKP